MVQLILKRLLPVSLKMPFRSSPFKAPIPPAMVRFIVFALSVSIFQIVGEGVATVVAPKSITFVVSLPAATVIHISFAARLALVLSTSVRLLLSFVTPTDLTTIP